MAHSASIAYKTLMQEVLKPATQVRFNEETDLGYLSLGSPDNVDTALMRGFRTPPVPNYRRFATLDNFGWKVDDDSYACASSGTTTGNNCFITKELTANTDTAIQDNISTSGIEGEVYLKIAPIQCSSITIKFGKTDHHGDFAETPQEVTIDGTTMTDFETVSFTVEEDMYLLKFNVSEACRISYYPLSTNDADPVAIFDNSNILSVDVEEYADLYSQELPRFNVTVKIYDAEGKYDPINPQGEFSKFVQGYSVYMGLGYEVNGYLETPFWVVLYLNDTPKYENHEITLTFTTAQSGDNKYVNTLPVIAGNAGDPVSNKTYYGINTAVSIDSSGYDSLITLAEISQIAYSIYGNGFVNLPRPMYSSRVLYKNGTPKHFTDYDIIDKNSIKIDRKPVLKALTIKQYTNTIPTTYQETVSGSAPNSNYQRWSTTDARPFRMIVNIDADVSDICRIDELSLSGASNMAWSFVNAIDPDSGAATLQFWIYCASYNAAGTTTYSLGLSHVRQVTNDVTESVNADGENMVIDNPFITDSSLLESCSNLVKNTAYYRDYYTFDAIADYLTDVGDWIVIDTPYEKGVSLFVTDIKYKMPGGTCTITGNRRFSVAASDYSTDVTRFVYINGVEYIGFVSFALVGYFHTTSGNTDVVLVSASNGINSARIQIPSTGYDTVNDGNVITITDSTSLTWYCDVADHSTPGIYYPDGCMYLGTFANVEAAARYLILKAYADQGFTVTLEV
jgi:hypothetical protein